MNRLMFAIISISLLAVPTAAQAQAKVNTINAGKPADTLHFPMGWLAGVWYLGDYEHRCSVSERSPAEELDDDNRKIEGSAQIYQEIGGFVVLRQKPAFSENYYFRSKETCLRMLARRSPWGTAP